MAATAIGLAVIAWARHERSMGFRCDVPVEQLVATASADTCRTWRVDGYLERGSAILDTDTCVLRFNLVEHSYVEGNKAATRIPVRYPSCILPEPFGDYPRAHDGSSFVPNVHVLGYFHQEHQEPSWWDRIFAQHGEQYRAFAHQPIALPHFDATQIGTRSPFGKFEICNPMPCPVPSFLVPQPIRTIHHQTQTRP